MEIYSCSVSHISFFPCKILLPGFLINFIFQVLDVIVSSTDDEGPLSLENFRKNNLSASWRIAGLKTSNATYEVSKTDAHETFIFCVEKKMQFLFYCYYILIHLFLFLIKAKPTSNTWYKRKTKGEGRQIFRLYHTSR